MSSIIQFHHHDKNGNIIFAVTTITCDGNVHNHSHSKHTSCGCEHHHDHDCGSGENCSAHLGDYQATKQTNIAIDNSPTILFASITDSEIGILNNTELCTYITFAKNAPIVEGVTCALSLRAPPIS